MKNLAKLVGITVIVAVIGFSMVACDDGSDNTHTHSFGSWQSNAEQHWKECSCGEEYGRSSHSGNPTCTTCGYYTGGGGGTHTHTYGSWQTSSTQHWRVCTICGDEAQRGSHSGNPTCTICGYSTGGSGGSTVPSAPTGVSASALSSNSIRVSWNAVSGATSYKVYYANADNSNPSLYYSVSAPQTSRDFSSLLSSRTYYYKVSAVNSLGEGVPSSIVSAYTSPALLNAPTGVTATANSSSSITVNWNSVSNASMYKVYRSTNSTGPFTHIGGSYTTSYVDTDLSANTTYYYKVSTLNSDIREGSQSITTGSARTQSGGSSVPSAPTGVTATRNPAGSTTVRVSWNAVSGATGYRVYYSSTGSGSGTLEGSPSTTSFNSSSNSTTATHYFRVSAVNSAGEGSPSSWVSVGPVSGGGSTGTIRVVNSSTYSNDPITNTMLWTGNYSPVAEITSQIPNGDYFSFTNVPVGSYYITVRDNYGNSFSSSTFNVTAGQTRTVTYNGSGLAVSN